MRMAVAGGHATVPCNGERPLGNSDGRADSGHSIARTGKPGSAGSNLPQEYPGDLRSHRELRRSSRSYLGSLSGANANRTLPGIPLNGA